MSKKLYIKIGQCVQVTDTKVKIGDVAELECADQSTAARLKDAVLLDISENPEERAVVSILWVIRKIHEIYPDLEVQNLGETDFIVERKSAQVSAASNAVRVMFVSLITFFGSVFAMMTFNEDVSALDSFRKVYTWVTGVPPQGTTVLELGYSLGVGAGIILFLNRIGKKRLTKEPSPVEVEMSGYDTQLYSAVIQNQGRKGQEKDVG